jgi:hypothetical protein
MCDIRNLVREVLSEIVSTEVDRAPGGGPDVQKNQSGYGYSGNQSDAPKQERKNDQHIYFNNVTSTSGDGNSSDSDTVEESEELMEDEELNLQK